MESTQDKLKKLLFSGPMPEMPQNYREYFNMAFAFRRKYLDMSRSTDETFRLASEDMQLISNAYDSDPLLMGLLIECYEDIERCIAEGNNE